MAESDATMSMEVDEDVDVKEEPNVRLFIPPSPTFKKGAIKRLSIKNFLTFGEAPPKPVEPGDRKSKGSTGPTALKYEFQPSINIISGPNGYGKSSIINAIALCCGSGPKFLRRGNVYADLIKRGPGIDQAEIELTLHNPDCPKGETRFARLISKLNRNNAYFIDGNKKNRDEFRRRLKEEFRIVPENLTMFLLQDRIADLVDLDSFKLLKCAEQSLAKEVWEMHNELIERRTSWIETEKKLKELGEENEPQILKRSEADKAAKKLRERSERFEKMMAIRLKLLVQSIQSSESEKSAVEQDLARESQDAEDWKTATASCYLAFKGLSKPLKEKPPEFPSSGTVRACLANLEEVSRIAGDMRGAVQGSQRQMSDLTDLSIAQSPEEDLAATREELAREEAALTQKEPKESLKQKRKEKDEQLEAKKAEQMAKKEEREVEVERLRKLEENRNGIARELRKLPGTKQNRKRRLEELHRNGHLHQDVVKVWEIIEEEKETFEGHVYGPLLLHIFPTEKHKDSVSMKVMETVFGYKTLRSFLVDSQQMCSLMLERFSMREGRKISIAFMCNRIDMSPFNDDTLAEFRKYGFSTVLDKMYEAPPLVKQYLQQAFTSQTVLFAKKPKRDAVANVAENWTSRSADNDRLVFCTDQSLYEIVKLNGNPLTMHEQPLKEACLLKSEAGLDEASQTEKRRELDKKLDEADKELADFKKYMETIDLAIEDLNVDVFNLDEDSRQIDDALEEVEEISQNIATLQEKLNNLTQIDSKPSPIRMKELAKEIREKNRKRLEVLCGATNGALAKLQETTKTLQVVFSEVVKKTGLLLHTSRSHARLMEYGKKQRETEEVRKRLKATLGEMEAEVAENKQQARTLTKELFCDRERSSTDVKTIFEQLSSFRTPAALLRELRRLHETVMASGTDKVNPTKVQEEIMEQTKKQEDFLRTKQNLEFDLRKLQLSQGALRTQWLSKLQNDIDVIDRSFRNMLNEMTYSGSVELVKPLDPLEYDKYGLKLKVRFREEEDEEDLRPNQQSGGQRVVAIAVFLLALQRRSDAPFRIVDEINQGMDTGHEKSVFQLMINAASTFAQSGGQMISCSPKIPPDFEAENLSVLNFITLMKVDRLEDVEHYKMEHLRNTAIENARREREDEGDDDNDDNDVTCLN